MMAGFPYEDIITLDRPVSRKHMPMPVLNRAAQFMPFAALKGYDTAIAEMARTTVAKIEVSTETSEEMSRKLVYIMAINEKPHVKITYFQSDSRKNGGIYIVKTGVIKKVDMTEKYIIFTDGTRISFDAVCDIDGDIFTGLEF